MKLALYSDLHNECGTPWVPPASAEAADMVILAGDIGGHTHGIAWASQKFPNQYLTRSIIYVAGNHEYYSAHLGLLAQMRLIAAQCGVTFLERNVVRFAGVRVLGCTLWSDFALYGNDQRALAMRAARQGINDYWMIHAAGGRQLEPEDTAKIHRKSVAWLDEELSRPFDGKTVVVTHFAPHRGCVAPQHEGSDVSPYFVSNLAWLMAKHRIDLWCHGHTHTSNNFVAEGGCRVVSNALGYPGERNRTHGGVEYSTGFCNELMIDL